MGLASEEEANLVAEMVARYPEVKAELAAIEISLENFDQKNAVAPPAHLKNEILNKTKNVSGSQFPVSGNRNGKTESKVVSIAPGKQSNYKFAAVAALVLLLITAGYALYVRSELASKELEVFSLNNELILQRSNLAVKDTLVNELSDENFALITELNLLKKPGMKSIELKGMEPAPDAKAMAYANVSTGEVYLEIMNLPAAPEGMQYQFWGIVDSKPVDAGMIPVEEKDLDGIHPMITVQNATAYAISLEPMGGSQQPTGKIYVMGNP